ncbi:tetraspanin-33-like [Amblyomma americanum]
MSETTAKQEKGSSESGLSHESGHSRSPQRDKTLLLDVNPAVRFPLLGLNLALWGVGAFLMLGSVMMIVDSWDSEGDERILAHLDMSGLLLSHMESLLFAFGLMLFTVSSCGCVGALRENTCLLRLYSLALTVLIVLNLALGVLVFFMPGSIKSVIKKTMTLNLVVNYRDSPDVQELVDALQRFLKCCGMTNHHFRDWDKNIYFHCDVKNPSYERCSVPSSCCRRGSGNTGTFCGRNVLNLSDHDAWFHVYTRSCPDAMNHYVKEHVMVFGGVCLIAVIVLAFVDMITNAVIDEIHIIRKIYDQVRGALATTPQGPPSEHA